MIERVRNIRLGLAAVAVAAAAVVSAAPASAQSLFFDWGGGSQSVGGSGKENVSFPANVAPGQIIVSFGDRKLYHVTGRGQAVAYPIAIPRDQSRWQGVTSVSQKRENPSWTPTPTMRAENPRLPMWVPGGHPMNPLGVRALYLGSSAYRIHGTDAPWTIGSAVSKGCVRMYNQDVIDLYPRINVGTKVTVTWNRYNVGSAVAAAEDAPTPSAGMRDRQARATRYYKPISQVRRARTAQAATEGAAE